MMTTEALGETIRRVLRDAPFAMRQLAADAGLSYDVLRSWRSGRRRPSRASAQRLAEGLERRGERLLTLSRELRQIADERGADTGAGAVAGREKSAASQTERPAGYSERPATSADRPAATSDRPAASSDRPTGSPDRPFGAGAEVTGPRDSGRAGDRPAFVDDAGGRER